MFRLALVCLLALVPILSVLTQPSSEVQFQNLTLSRKTYFHQTRCQGFKVNANYRKLKLTFESQNIDHLLITNRLINSCDEEIFSECDEQSNLCIQSHISNKAEFSIGKCMDHFYVYAYIKNFVGGSVIVKMAQSSGCDSISQDPYTICASIPISECGVKGVKNCNKNCRRIDCSFTNNVNKNLTSLQTCLPADSAHYIWNQRCNEDFNFYKAYSKRIISNQCGKDPTSDIYGNQKGGVFSFIAWVLFITLLAIIASSLFYRYKLNKTGVAPFSAPQWTPNFLYPRRNVFIVQDTTNYREI